MGDLGAFIFCAVFGILLIVIGINEGGIGYIIAGIVSLLWPSSTNFQTAATATAS